MIFIIIINNNKIITMYDRLIIEMNRCLEETDIPE